LNIPCFLVFDTHELSSGFGRDLTDGNFLPGWQHGRRRDQAFHWSMISSSMPTLMVPPYVEGVDR
jgi:hypothetical protein